MCHYITAVLPSKANVAALDVIVRPFGRQLRPIANPSMREQLGAGHHYCFTTRGHCDCDTSLGALLRLEAAQRKDDKDEAEAKRWRRQGWSESKIERVLAQREDQRARERQKVERIKKTALESGASVWQDCIRAVLVSGETDAFGLLLHWYSGGLDGRIVLEGHETVRLADLDASALGMMRDDVLYTFVR